MGFSVNYTIKIKYSEGKTGKNKREQNLMSLSEIEILKQENKSILEGYAKVSDLCKNLIF